MSAAAAGVSDSGSDQSRAASPGGGVHPASTDDATHESPESASEGDVTVGGGGGGEEDEEEEEEVDAAKDEVPRLRRCSYEGCAETTARSARQAGQLTATGSHHHHAAWMCKKHKNKAYKAKFKTKKNFSAGGASGGGGGKDKKDLATAQQRRGTPIKEPPVGRKATLLECVLNQKRQARDLHGTLALLRSPAVMQTLREHQQKCLQTFSTDMDPQP
ncbi:unnamed protein product [Lampetra fluviatilis]